MRAHAHSPNAAMHGACLEDPHTSFDTKYPADGLITVAREGHHSPPQRPNVLHNTPDAGGGESEVHSRRDSLAAQFAPNPVSLQDNPWFVRVGLLPSQVRGVCWQVRHPNRHYTHAAMQFLVTRSVRSATLHSCPHPLAHTLDARFASFPGSKKYPMTSSLLLGAAVGDGASSGGRLCNRRARNKGDAANRRRKSSARKPLRTLGGAEYAHDAGRIARMASTSAFRSAGMRPREANGRTAPVAQARDLTTNRCLGKRVDEVRFCSDQPYGRHHC